MGETAGNLMDRDEMTQQISPTETVNLIDLLADFAEIGFGLACVVREFCAGPLASGRVFPVRLTQPLPERYVGACWAKDTPLSPCAREFLRLLQGA